MLIRGPEEGTDSTGDQQLSPSKRGGFRQNPHRRRKMMYGAAHRDLEKAVSLAPGSYPAHYLLGSVLVKTGHPKRGIAQYQKAITISPKEPRTYYRMGLTLEAQGETEEAIQYFKKALQVDQQYAPAYCQLGKLQFRAHKLREAAQELSLAIQYNPAIQESYYLLI